MDRPRLRGARSIEEGRTAAEKSAVAGGTTEAIAASTSACVRSHRASGRYSQDVRQVVRRDRVAVKATAAAFHGPQASASARTGCVSDRRYR